jgi:hypothetical protein
MMEAMKREDWPMMEEERPVAESVTSPAKLDGFVVPQVQSNVRINLSRIVHPHVSSAKEENVDFIGNLEPNLTYKSEINSLVI